MEKDSIWFLLQDQPWLEFAYRGNHFPKPSKERWKEDESILWSSVWGESLDDNAVLNSVIAAINAQNDAKGAFFCIDFAIIWENVTIFAAKIDNRR